MAKQTSTLDRRLSPRNHDANRPSAAALKGALTAFHATPSRDLLQVPSHRSGTAMGPSHQDPGGSDPLPELPEPGSIRDKIAKFSANSTPSAGSAFRNTSDIREKSPQRVAAQLAVRNLPAPSSKMSTAVAVQRAQPLRNDEGRHRERELPLPTPMQRAILTRNLVGKVLEDSEELSSESTLVQQKPITPVSSVSPRPAATKQPPAPPASRRLAPVSTGPASSAPISHRLDKLKRPEEPQSSSPSPLRSKTSSSTLSEDWRPTLPARRADSTPFTKDIRDHRSLLGESRSPVRPSSSSATSLYSQSQNRSSSSILDSSTDASREGRSEAVVASSLASSRALQAKKSPPPPPPQRRRRSRSLLQLQHQSKKERTPNPSPGSLRQTLRAETRSDDEEDHHRRHLHHQHSKHIIHKHPHKHHEGDRRKWRSEVTEKERKRYEGVWAANKGLLIPPNQILKTKDPEEERPPNMYPANAMEMVVNLVVQDIWTRSRLPDHVLEQIWNLVDGQKIGLLTREEFVVGMWLIDQQLRGHKLPVVVPDSVWGSVKRIPGISLDDFRS